jgi:outer membrane lipoprotein SlyB
MKQQKYFRLTLLAVALCVMALPTMAQNSTALERGYRTGYNDGYSAGYKDVADRATRDYHSKDEYQKADRAYVDAWGPLDDYRDGYQQGYEIGYQAGYDRQPFSSAMPAGFKKRGATDNQNNPAPSADSNQPTNTTAQPNAPTSAPVNMNGTLMIPRDTMFLIELDTPLSTDVSQRGDHFRAHVVDPRDYQGAVIEGHVTDVKRAAKVKGTAQLQLSFDQIRLPDNRWANLHAELVEVVSQGSSDGVADVDKEGGVKGKDQTKDTVTKVGAGAGVGALIGAIVGGGRGAAIGAAIGGSVGTAGVLTSHGKDIKLARGQQLRIRTSSDTTIQ